MLQASVCVAWLIHSFSVAGGSCRPLGQQRSGGIAAVLDGKTSGGFKGKIFLTAVRDAGAVLCSPPCCAHLSGLSQHPHAIPVKPQGRVG